MLTLSKFTGINNVLPTERLVPDPRSGETPLAEATNVDINTDGEVLRRAGFSEQSAVCHKNVWEGAGFLLATRDGDLVNANTGTVLYPALGVSRVWYLNFPDGRTGFSNGLISGITDGTGVTTWGVPLPTGLGAATPVTGDLYPGEYRWALTHVRAADGLEGAPLYSDPVTLDGGVVLTGLPVLAGHSINVYLTSANDDVPYLAGNTTGSSLAFTGANNELALPCATHMLYPMPVGTVCAFWRGIALVADGKRLCASRAHQWELFDQRRDVKQFPHNITLIQPVDDGIFIGTTTELGFMQGTEFDKLEFTQCAGLPVVLGSGVDVDGEQIRKGDGVGQDSAMLCICGGGIVAGFNGGAVVHLTRGVYHTDTTEVAATFRVSNGIPQYIAIEQ